MVAAENPFHQQFPQSSHFDSQDPSLIKSGHMATLKSEPSQSDHPLLSYSDPQHLAASYSSDPQHLAHMPGIHQDLRYASPTHPADAMPLMQNSYYSAFPSAVQTQETAVAPPPRSEPPPKTFHCSTCSKGFARRSDLARHGMFHSSQNVIDVIS